jgi:hypothetical protein
MNRRDFLKVAGIVVMGIFFPHKGEEMELADVWVKIANQARLTPQELDYLKRSANETQQRNAFLAGNTTPDGKLKAYYPIEIIYSEILSTNLTSITVNIPSDYKHLWILGGGRTTDGGTSAVYFLFQFSGDTGNNYINQKFTAVNTTLAGSGRYNCMGCLFFFHRYPTRQQSITE